MKIAIIGISSINNVGEYLLIENTGFLARQSFDSAEFKVVEISPDRKVIRKQYRIESYLADRLGALSHHFPGLFRDILKKWSFQVRYSSYYIHLLKDADAVIYAFGMLKYSTQDANYLFYTLNSIAEKLHIPVFMNAMSVQKYDAEDPRAKNLVEACTKKCVRMITTRDGVEELNELNAFYASDRHSEKGRIATSMVADVALWSPEALHLPRKAFPETIRTIGINVINLQQFQLYGNNVTEEDFFDFYRNLISDVTKNNYAYKLFSNGMDVNHESGKKIVNALHLPQDTLLNIAGTPVEYVRMLCSFDCVFATRLHTSITCYAFNIPVVALVWDNKIRAFYRKIRRQSLTVEPEKLREANIVAMLEEASRHPYDEKLFGELKGSTLQSFKDFARLIR